ncbi:MAG: VCBS repeat-containing protein [Pseudomonadales bacterium]|nr:VCBS repeat-containing protein [Pseudomonadales bacterium]
MIPLQALPQDSPLPVTMGISSIVRLLPGLILSCWLSPVLGAFNLSELSTGAAQSQTVLHGDFSGTGTAEIIVFSVAEDRRRSVQRFVMREGRYVAASTEFSEVPQDLILVDTARLASGDALIGFSSDLAYVIDTTTGNTRPLLRFRSLYNNVVEKELPVMDIMQDINGDGFDDFLMPDFRGYQVSVQQSDGGFPEPVSLFAPPAMDVTYNSHPWYEARTPYVTDMTLDGVNDLTFWYQDAFLVYPGTGQSFATTAISFRPEVAFEYEGYEGMSMRMGGEDQSDSVRKALFQLKDLDGDQIPELVTLKVRSEGVFNKKSTYEIYQGKAGKQLVSFGTEPVSSIESDGIQFQLDEKDLNNDGQTDIIISSVEIGLGKIVRALLTGSVRIQLGFHQMRDGSYGSKPDSERDVVATFSMSTGEVFFPSVLMTDVSGDGLLDLLVQEGREALHVYTGEGAERLFSRERETLEIPMPARPDLVQLADLDGDGRSDLIIRIDDDKQNQRLLVLQSAWGDEAASAGQNSSERQ